ncbi:Sec-independent protein translocase subunit TatA [Herbiconiux sp. CPCC 205763]|uniref:Sec-independent protein translocase protein TatA n=1 Tax=Herbiconiux aconitum TaxID=2970913 RepID=A0ABT2GMG5_9MICO|nr:Sec-independent protein translocase subunit TatA [Herbiconiux aconitum]MCS5716777.1 Sec-independent protein translocase subunit TatA [Herbiconiux aconitum]
MLGNLNGWHLVIILVVVLLLFGATRLPALSKSVAQSMRIFKSETKAMKDDDAKPETVAAPAATPAADATPAPAPAPVSSEATSTTDTKS